MRRPGVLEPFADGNFSLYFCGQVISHTGMWFQNLALALVVLNVTGSAQALSGVTIAQFLPLLVFSIPAGWLADRLRPRTILLCTSLLATGIVAALAVVAGSEEPRLEAIYALVAMLGTVSTFERIAAQAIIFELVGPAGLTRAVSISTIALASARSIGPGLAGLAFQALGPTACMLLNSAAYLLVFTSILLLRSSRFHPRMKRSRSTGEHAPETLRSNRAFLVLLAVNVIVALLSLNLMLVLTSTVTLTYGGDATAVGAVHALNALGAIVGGLLAAGRGSVGVRSLVVACTGLGLALAANAAAPTLPFFLMLGPVLGLAVGYYHGILQAAAQASVPPPMIGRAMSLVTMGNYGMAPLGAILMGWVIDASSGRVAMALGGLGALAAAAVAFFALRRPGRERESP